MTYSPRFARDRGSLLPDAAIGSVLRPAGTDEDSLGFQSVAQRAATFGPIPPEAATG